MPLQGPIIVVSHVSNVPLADAIKALHEPPIVECTFAQAAEHIRSAWPAAVIVSDRPKDENRAHVEAIGQALEFVRQRDAFVPTLMRVGTEFGPAIPNALPIGMTTK